MISNDNKISDTTYPLNTIVQQPEKPFNSFTGGEFVAYQYVSQSLVPESSDIRVQYINLPLISTFTSVMNKLSCPLGSNQQEFDTVKTQLTLEFEHVRVINSLFSLYGQFHTDLFTNSKELLNSIISSLGIPKSNYNDSTGSFGTLLSSVINALPLTPGIGQLIANIIQTGFNIGKSNANSESENAITSDPFSVDVSGLWGLLSSNFTTLLNITSQIQTKLLLDWGMIEATYSLIGSSLSGISKDELLTSCKAGYETSLVKFLMPTIYQIYVAKNSDTQNVPKDVPSTCLYKTENHVYWIASNETSKKYPTDDFMNTFIWGNKVNQQHFYVSKYGWNFPTSVVSSKTGKSGSPTISNNTEIQMNLLISYEKDRDPYGPTFTRSIEPYSSFIYIDNETTDPLPELETTINCKIEVTRGDTGKPVASFTYMIYAPPNGIGKIYILSSLCRIGYKFNLGGTTYKNNGNNEEGFASSVLTPIYLCN